VLVIAIVAGSLRTLRADHDPDHDHNVCGSSHFRISPPEGIYMPTYEYLCTKCRKKFSLRMSISEHDTKKIRCPKCKSTKVEQQLKSFFVVTSKKS